MRQKQPFFGDVFFGRLVQLLLKQSEQIALADKKMVGDLLYSREGAKVFVGVFQRLGDQRGERCGLLGDGNGKCKNRGYLMNMNKEQELSLLKRRAREIYRQKLKDKKRQEFIGYIEETKKTIHDDYIRRIVLRGIVETYHASKQR